MTPSFSPNNAHL